MTPKRQAKNGHTLKYHSLQTDWHGLQNHQNLSKIKKASQYTSLIILHAETSPPSPHPEHMHMNKLPYRKHETMPTKKTVYQLTCRRCNKFYIGNTTRFVHDRIKEHLNKKNSNLSVGKHIIMCKGTNNNQNSQGVNVKIIAQENDPVNLRLFEAFFIRKCKPELHFCEECIELRDLLF